MGLSVATAPLPSHVISISNDQTSAKRHDIGKSTTTILDSSSVDGPFDLVDLPTTFDPDADPVSPRSAGVTRTNGLEEGDEEDVLRVPVITAEDEEEAAAAAAAAEREREDEGIISGSNWMEMIKGLQEGEEMDGVEEEEGQVEAEPEAAAEADVEGDGQGEIVVELREQPEKETEKEADIPSGKQSVPHALLCHRLS